MNDEVEIGYVFLHIVHCHNGIRCEVKVEEENLDSGIVAETEQKRSLECRSSRPEVFCKKGVLRNFTKFTGKHLWHDLFL